MTKRLSNLDMNQNQLLQALAQVLGSDPGSPVAGQFWYHSGTGTLRFRTGSSTVILGRLDQIQAPTGDVSFNSQKATNLANGTNGTDAVNLQQLNDAIAGLNWKDEVRVWTNAALPSNTYSGGVLTASANGSLNTAGIDGVTTLAVGERVGVKDESSGLKNGLYTITSLGAAGAAWVLTRASDADTGAEMLQATAWATEGTNNNDTAWACNTNGPITLGTTALTFAKAFSSGLYSADGTTIILTGSTFSLSTPVTVANGGTNSGTAAGARTNLGAAGKYTATIGNGSSTSIAVTHNLGTRAVVVSVHDASTFDEVECDVTKTDTNNVTLGFAVAPASSGLVVTVIG